MSQPSPKDDGANRHCLSNSLAQAARVVPPAVQPRRQGRQIGWCHAPRPARHQEFLVDAKGVWPENGQFGSPAAPLQMVWKKICHCVVSCSFPVPRHVRGGMVDSFSDRSLMLTSMQLLNEVEMLSLCTCHISIAAAIFLTSFSSHNDVQSTFNFNH